MPLINQEVTFQTAGLQDRVACFVKGVEESLLAF